MLFRRKQELFFPDVMLVARDVETKFPKQSLLLMKNSNSLVVTSM